MTMMGGPIDARKSPTAVNNLAMNRFRWFREHVITACRQLLARAPGGVTRLSAARGFMAMNPIATSAPHYDYFLDLVRGDGDSADSHRQFYDEYNAVLDMPTEYYLETIARSFQDFCPSTAPGT